MIENKWSVPIGYKQADKLVFALILDSENSYRSV